MITEQWSKVSGIGFVLFNLEEFQPIFIYHFSNILHSKRLYNFLKFAYTRTYVIVCHHVLTENLRVKRKFFFLVAATGI